MYDRRDVLEAGENCGNGSGSGSGTGSLLSSREDISATAETSPKPQTSEVAAANGSPDHRILLTETRLPVLRATQAKSIDGSGESPSGSPRARRPPRESRRVSLARTPDYIQLNQYKLLEPIGQGSYGIVKLAYNEEDDTHYAMKILSKKKLMRRAGMFGRLPPRRGISSGNSVGGGAVGDTISPDSDSKMDPLRKVYREIALLKKLDHANVVKLVEVLDDPQEDQLYLVFELVEGGSVLEIGSDAPLPLETAHHYFRDALLAVEYLHFQRIVHRDIKPANLLVGADGHVLLGDLGGAGQLGTSGAANPNSSAHGTPAFRAPEVCDGTVGDPRASDVWSLGATLFALVHGSLPFSGHSVSEVTAHIRSAPLQFASSSPAPPALRHLLHRMMHKDPLQRATIHEIKNHPWVTNNGTNPMTSTEENCRLVEVTDEDMERVVTSIPNLATLILIKTMLKKHSFQNPFSRTRENSREGSASEGVRSATEAIQSPSSPRLSRPPLRQSGRSASAPSNYLSINRQASFDVVLPSVDEYRNCDTAQKNTNVDHPRLHLASKETQEESRREKKP